MPSAHRSQAGHYERKDIRMKEWKKHVRHSKQARPLRDLHTYELACTYMHRYPSTAKAH